MIEKLSNKNIENRNIKLYKSNFIFFDKPNNIYINCNQKYRDGLSFAAEISCS